MTPQAVVDSQRRDSDFVALRSDPGDILELVVDLYEALSDTTIDQVGHVAQQVLSGSMTRCGCSASTGCMHKPCTPHGAAHASWTKPHASPAPHQVIKAAAQAPAPLQAPLPAASPATAPTAARRASEHAAEAADEDAAAAAAEFERELLASEAAAQAAAPRAPWAEGDDQGSLQEDGISDQPTAISIHQKSRTRATSEEEATDAAAAADAAASAAAGPQYAHQEEDEELSVVGMRSARIGETRSSLSFGHDEDEPATAGGRDQGEAQDSVSRGAKAAWLGEGDCARDSRS